MKDFYTQHIATQLKNSKDALKKQYNESQAKVGTRHFFLDNVLPPEQTMQIFSKFDVTNPAWREMKSFRENKLTSKSFKSFDRTLEDITFALQEKAITDIIGEITGINNLKGDEALYAGGLSLMRPGDFLNPHIDNSHDQDKKNYRRLNILFYVSPDWSIENGGNLELWNNDVTRREEICSKFNRLVIMETNSKSWHSVNQVKKNKNRCCVSNYYFTKESPTGEEYFHVTSFHGRPEQKFRRIYCQIDNFLREAVRLINPKGFGKRDIYIKN